jgi:glycerol-3-phosphate O-acyltransferase/dihydroxyacetone phosphate acyltransferase
MRRVVTSLVAFAAKIFFRRIEIAGVERVPAGAPVIFAVNHPNALIDPLFLLCFAPRKVSFLAKAPLFHLPVIGWLARAFDSIPVYRRQDNYSTSMNRQTFAQARAVLEGGGAIAIFPEGTTHSDPRLRELKTGAARIALSASMRVSIVPTGLYYTAKQTFRSAALVYFGLPIVVEPEPVDAAGEARPESVAALTAGIEKALSEVTLQADSHVALELIARAERLFSANDDIDLAHELELRKQFTTGYAYLRERDPARLTRLESQIRQIDADQLGTAQPIGAGHAWLLLLLPVGVVGAILHWPVYRLIGFLATHVARAEDEMVATIKTVAGLLLYPLLWVVAAAAMGLHFGIWSGLATLIALPVTGYVALMSLETLDDIIGRLRATRRGDLQKQQRALRDEIVSIAREINATSTSMSETAGSSGA